MVRTENFKKIQQPIIAQLQEKSGFIYAANDISAIIYTVAKNLSSFFVLGNV